MKIEELNMSERTTNALILNKVYSTEDLVKLTQEDVMKFHRFGRMSLLELMEKMKEMNLSFRSII